MDIGLQQSAYNRSQARQSRALTEKRNHTGRVEAIAEAIFTLCAFFAVFAVGAITLYMIANGVPAVYRLGVREIFFSSVWTPGSGGTAGGRAAGRDSLCCLWAVGDDGLESAYVSFGTVVVS